MEQAIEGGAQPEQGLAGNFREAMRLLLKTTPESQKQWDERERTLDAMLRASAGGSIGVTIARLLIEKPAFFALGVLGLGVGVVFRAIPFVYHLLT